MSEHARPIEIFLNPGELFVGDERHRVRTLLGSCVSVTIWHPVRRVGAMTHSLLSARKGRHTKLDGRYGEEAMTIVLNELKALDVAPMQCQAKLFGGSSMFASLRTRHGQDIGRQNAEATRKRLAELKIPLISESLYGSGHRMIIFDIGTGDVWARYTRTVVPELPPPGHRA